MPAYPEGHGEACSPPMSSLGETKCHLGIFLFPSLSMWPHDNRAISKPWTLPFHLPISWQRDRNQGEIKMRCRWRLLVFPIRELPSLGLRLPNFLLLCLSLVHQDHITQAADTCATFLLICLRWLSSKSDGCGHVLFSGCPYCHVIGPNTQPASDKKVMPDLHNEFFLF